MLRSIVRGAAPLLLVALLAPAPAAAGPPQPVCGKAIVGPGTYDWLMCGMPDLDQVRAITSDPSVHSLPNHGKMYCVPTATANVLSYMAGQGFATKIASKDWEDPANYNEAADELLELGMEMGTSGTGGTGGQGFFDGLLGRVQGAGQVSQFVLQYLTYSAEQEWHAPDPEQLALAGMHGALIMTGIGFYKDEADPDGVGTVKRRVGGHMLTAVGAASGPNGTATLIVRDPATSYATNTVQTPYANDAHALAPFTFKGIYEDQNGVDHTYDGTAMTWDGSQGTLWEGYAKVVPVTGWTWHPGELVAIQPFELIPDPGPEIATFPVKGRVLDLALSAETIAPAFLRRGSNMVFSLDPFTEAITAIGAVKGASALAFGGAAQDLYVAGARKIVAFDQDGMKVASRKLQAPLADLAFDGATGLLVGLAEDGSALRFFNDALKPKGKQALGMLAEGVSELALTPKGGVLLKAPGATEILKTAKVSKLASFSGSYLAAKKLPRLREVDLRGVGERKRATGLAVDDLGNLLIQIGGRTKHFKPNGKQIKGSPFARRPGIPLAFDRSFTSFDAASWPTPLDFVPDDGIPAADLTLVLSPDGKLIVRNQGLAGAGPFAVRVVDDLGRGPFEVPFPSGLAAGASQAVEIPCESFARTATADANDQVPEGDEANNSLAWPGC